MIGFQCHSCYACLLFVACALNAVLGDDRCTIAGRCTDPSTLALQKDATGSLLQVKSSPSTVAAEVASEVEQEVGNVEQELAAVTEDALSDLETVEKSVEETAPAEIEKVAEEANEFIENQVALAKGEGLEAIKGASNAAAKQVDTAADALQEGLSEAEVGLEKFRLESDLAMRAEEYRADGAIDAAYTAAQETFAGMAPNAKLANQARKGVQQVVGPYVDFAKGSIGAERNEVIGFFSGFMKEVGGLKQEADGLAVEAEQAAKSGKIEEWAKGSPV